MMMMMMMMMSMMMMVMICTSSLSSFQGFVHGKDYHVHGRGVVNGSAFHGFVHNGNRNFNYDP